MATVNEKEVTISTSVEQIKKIHPESTPAVAVCIKENPNIIIESAVVEAESNGSTVTLISKSESKKELVVQKYTSTNKTASKVDEQIVPIYEIAVPKPTIKLPIRPAVIVETPVLMEEVRKVINKDVTTTIESNKITSVTVTKNTNV